MPMGLTLNSLPMQMTPQPLPPWLQTYIRTRPSYAEGQIQGPQWGALDAARAQAPPQPPNPQVDDIRRLFFNHIIQQAPPNPIPPGPDVADAIRRGLFTAGDEI